MRKLVGPFAAFVILLTSAFGQTAVAPASDPNAIAALQQSLAALGTSTANAPTSLSATATLTKYVGANSTSFAVRLEALGTDKFRRETDLPDGTHVVIVRGHAGWGVSPTRTDGLSLSQLAGSKFEDLPVLAISRWLTSANVQIQPPKPETLNGAPVVHLWVQPTAPADATAQQRSIYQETSRCEMFLDSQTYLPVRIRYYSHPNDWRLAIPVDLALSDYRPVNGVLFPFSITKYVRGVKLSSLQYQSFTLNPPLADSDFQAEVTQ